MKRHVKRFIIQLLNSNRTSNPANPLTGNFVDGGYFDELCYVGGNWTLSGVGRNALTYSNDMIVLVLESPHVDEFDNSGSGLRPLVKDRYLRNYLASLIDSAFKSGILTLNNAKTYSIYLMNAIQYQCSLGIPTEFYRDYVFMYLWENLSKGFKTRLKNLIATNNVEAIINLCTVGSHKQCNSVFNPSTNRYENMYKKFGLRFLNKAGFNIQGKIKGYTIKHIVQQKIDKISPTIQHLSGNHPSTPSFNKPFQKI